MSQKEILKELADMTTQHIDEANKFYNYGLDALSKKPNAQSWSALECLEHLNHYFDFYLNEINKGIQKAQQKHSEQYKSGFWGQYFINVMKKTGPDLKKMKAPKNMLPNYSEANIEILNRFITNLETLYQLIKASQAVDLGSSKTAISLTKFIKIKLGDTLQFVVVHNQRHMLQAKRAFLSKN